MPSRWTRAAAGVLLAAALVFAAQPAFAASVPARVGLVSFTGASLTKDGATLTVSWAAVSGATSYRVYAASSLNGVSAQSNPVVTTQATSAKITRLTPGREYWVQVRGVSAAGMGLRSLRVGHSTISAQPSKVARDEYRSIAKLEAMTWNVCSNACSGIGGRKAIIDARIQELKPAVVALQEASRYTWAPSGYAFGINGQNDILYRTSKLSPVVKDGIAVRGVIRFPRAYASAGRGGAWAALRDKSTGSYLLVFDVHLRTGFNARDEKQREFEAARLTGTVDAVIAQLNANDGDRTDWSQAATILLGDFNTNKSHTTDATQSILANAGWSDSYDLARKLTNQHYNSANPTRSSTPVIGVRRGDSVDKLFVRPTHTVVYSWANAGKMANGRFVTPLGSDHHPLMFTISLYGDRYNARAYGIEPIQATRLSARPV